jgi:hypothetical protein
MPRAAIVAKRHGGEQIPQYCKEWRKLVYLCISAIHKMERFPWRCARKGETAYQEK